MHCINNINVALKVMTEEGMKLTIGAEGINILQFKHQN